MARYRFRDYAQRPRQGDYTLTFFRDAAGLRPVDVTRVDTSAVVAAATGLLVTAGTKAPDVAAPDGLQELYVKGPNLFGNSDVQPMGKGASFTDPGMGNYPQMQGISTFQGKFREGFPNTGAVNPINPDNWQTIVNGVPTNNLSAATGMTVDRSTAGEVRILSGTTPSQETILRCLKPFTAPFQALFYAYQTQKIVNQAVFLELVSSDGTAVASWCIDATDTATTTQAVYEVQNGGPSRLRSANVNLSAAVTAVQAYEIEVTPQETYWYTRLPDNAAGRGLAGLRNTISPDPNAALYAQIRVVNKATAPASSTTVGLQALVVADYSELTAEITSGRGGSSPGMALPVNVTGTTAVSVTGTPTVSVATLAAATRTRVGNAVGPALIVATSRRLYGFQFANTAATWRFVKIFDKATAPVLGTDLPHLTIAVPPGGSIVDSGSSLPTALTAGIGYAVTTGYADTDVTSAAVGEVLGSFIHGV